MAVNENPKRPNKNTFLCGMSGTGKSNVGRTLVKRWKIPRVIAWDPDNDHLVKHRVYSMPDFIEYLKLNGKKAAFSVAFSGKASPETFERFCGAVFAVLDGNKETVVIGEELADVTNPGKAKPRLGELLRRGRKFGMVFLGVSQKPQEVSSTVYDQCKYFYVGRLRRLGAKRMYDEVDLPEAGTRSLPDLTFYKIGPDYTGGDPAGLAEKFRYTAPPQPKTPTP